jgi:hypothetical protein
MKKLLLGFFSITVLASCSNGLGSNIPELTENKVDNNSEEVKKTANDMTFSTKGYVCTSYGYNSYYSYDLKRRVYYQVCKKYTYYAPRTNYGGGGTRG